MIKKKVPDIETVWNFTSVEGSTSFPPALL